MFYRSDDNPFFQRHPGLRQEMAHLKHLLPMDTPGAAEVFSHWFLCTGYFEPVPTDIGLSHEWDLGQGLVFSPSVLPAGCKNAGEEERPMPQKVELCLC